jgi:hypothetical protein
LQASSLAANVAAGARYYCSVSRNPAHLLNAKFLLSRTRRAEFSFDSSHYLNHRSNVLTIIRISLGKQS